MFLFVSRLILSYIFSYWIFQSIYVGDSKGTTGVNDNDSDMKSPIKFLNQEILI